MERNHIFFRLISLCFSVGSFLVGLLVDNVGCFKVCHVCRGEDACNFVTFQHELEGEVGGINQASATPRMLKFKSISLSPAWCTIWNLYELA